MDEEDYEYINKDLFSDIEKAKVNFNGGKIGK